MKRFSEQLHKKSLSVSMRAGERAELRARLQSYMEYHPLAQGAKQTLSREERAVLTDPYQTFSFSFGQLARYAGAAVCAVLVVVSYTAEQTVPGDTLYPIKVRFNEEVRATLSFTPYQKITWETERLSRRIAEARVLADEGRLTGAVEVEVAEAVRTHGENARREIAELNETDKDEATLASLHLATTLDVQSLALRDGAGPEATMMAGAEMSSSESGISLLAETIASERSQTAVPGVDTMPAYERVLAHVETDTTRARELLSSIKGSATNEELTDIERRLADADRSMAAALELSNTDKDAARAGLLDVLQRTQKLIVFMNNIDVRAAVGVEEIVPVQLTPEERNVAVADAMSFARATIALTKTALISATFTPDESQRIDYIIEKLDEFLLKAEEALSQSDISAAEVAGVELKALSLDLRAMVGIDAKEPSPEGVEVDVSATTTPEVAPEEVATSTATTTEEVGE